MLEVLFLFCFFNGSLEIFHRLWKKNERTHLKMQNDHEHELISFCVKSHSVLLPSKQMWQMPCHWFFQALGLSRPVSFLVCLRRGGNQSHTSCSAAGAPQTPSPGGKMHRGVHAGIPANLPRVDPTDAPNWLMASRLFASRLCFACFAGVVSGEAASWQRGLYHPPLCLCWRPHLLQLPRPCSRLGSQRAVASQVCLSAVASECAFPLWALIFEIFVKVLLDEITLGYLKKCITRDLWVEAGISFGSA